MTRQEKMKMKKNLEAQRKEVLHSIQWHKKELDRDITIFEAFGFALNKLNKELKTKTK